MGPAGGLGPSGGVSSGQVVSNPDELDTTTKAYAMIVGDEEMTAEEQEREAYTQMLEKQRYRPSDIASLTQAQIENAEKAFADRSKIPGAGLLQAGYAVARNYMTAKEVDAQNKAMASERNLDGVNSDMSVNDLAAGFNSASLGDTTGGLLGSQLSIGEAVAGDYSTANTTSDGRNQGSDYRAPSLPAPPAPVGPTPSQPAEDEPQFAGQLGNYSSYARRVFSNINRS